MSDLYNDFVYTRISSSVGSADTTITVENTTLFPSNTFLAKGDFWLTIESALTYPNSFEIIKVTSVDTTTNVLTVTRGEEGTTAQSHSVATYLKGALTSGMLRRVRAGLSGTTVPVGTDSDLYQVGDSFYETSTGTSYVYTATGFVSAGGGALDTSMPVPSTPTLYVHGDTTAVSWDGLDVDGDPMPVGFQKLSIQQHAPVFTSVLNDDFSGVADTSPYVPAGFTQLGTTKIVSGQLQVLAVGSFLHSLFGIDIFQATYVSLSDANARVTVASPDPLTSVVFGFDDMASSTCTGLLVGFASGTTWDITTIESGAQTGNTSFDLTFDTAGTSFAYVDGEITVRDHTGAILATVTSPLAVTGTNAGIAWSSGTAIDRIEIESVAAGAATEVGSLAGAGVAFVTTPGSVTLVAVNEAGTAGSASGSLSVPSPASSLGNLGDVDFTSLANGDQIIFDTTSGKWVNVTPSPATLGGDLSGTVDAAVVESLSGVAFGNVATKNVGTSSGTVAAGDDSRFGKINGVSVSGTAASGNIIVASGSSAAAWTPPSASTVPFPPNASTNIYRLVPSSTTAASNALANGTVRLVPIFWNGGNIKTLEVDVTVAGNASSVLRLAFYGATASGVLADIPQGVISQWTVAVDSTGVQTVATFGTTGIDPTGGQQWFWLAAVVQGASTTQPTLKTCLPYAPPFPLRANTDSDVFTAAPFGYSATGYGVNDVLPNNIGSLVTCSDLFPVIVALT